MKTRNARNRQWRRHVRRIDSLDDRAFREHYLYLKSNPGKPSSTNGINVVVTNGLYRHVNKMSSGQRFWIPLR